MRTIKIKADTYRQDYNYRECKQNDDIPLEITLFEGGVSLDLSECTVMLNWIKADNTVVAIAGDTINVIDNIVSAILPRDCTRAVGQAKFELVITDNTSKQISTFPLSLEIIGSVIQGQQASNNVATLTEELNNANIAAINTKDELQNVIATADLTTYASQGQMQEVNEQLAEKMNNTKGTETDKYTDIFVGNSAKSANGYTKLPNGFLLQWGEYYGSTNNISYPVAFPTSCISVIFDPEINNIGSPTYKPKVGLIAKNHAGFTSSCYGYDELGITGVVASSMKWIKTVGVENLNAKVKYWAIGY